MSDGPRALPDVDQPAETVLLQARLSEAEETLRAIRNGEVDALVVRDATPDAQVFSLSSADRPYRIFVENMRDGAATVSEAGIVLYANRRLAELLGRPLQEVIGLPIASFIAEPDRPGLEAISGRGKAGGTMEAGLLDHGARTVPVRVNSSALDVDSHELLCLTFADLTHQRAQEREIAVAQAALTEQATHDALTGLPNRTLLVDRITQTLARAGRAKTSTGLIFVDLDGFKSVNDTGGHAVGDAVLREVADRLQNVVRPMDTVARLGGDEFVVLLPALESALNAVNVAQRIAENIDMPIALEHGTRNVTASIGVAVSNPTVPGSPATPDRLLQHADAAMYHAKSLGGARTEIFDADRTPTTFEANRKTWVARIRTALDEDGFELFAQPIVELATGGVVQHELLLRMRDTDGDLIPPLSFLPTAERCGLIGEIDRWVIREAIALATRGHRVALNLSAASAGEPEVLELIERELTRHDTDPGNLVFEITETTAMQNIDRGEVFAARLVEMGCRFALDDFGTGFASFTYLKRLPVQYLKIDIEFVRDLVRSPRDESVVRAIVALAAGFGQQTIAEGVEDDATAAMLCDLGVDYAQGYLFGRPAPIVGELAQVALR
jgi:diguanylate cyclase (GGDEF)-like protein/PAS domain S-box-containing protein